MAARKAGDRPGRRGGSTGDNADNEALADELHTEMNKPEWKSMDRANDAFKQQQQSGGTT